MKCGYLSHRLTVQSVQKEMPLGIITLVIITTVSCGERTWCILLLGSHLMMVHCCECWCILLGHVVFIICRVMFGDDWQAEVAGGTSPISDRGLGRRRQRLQMVCSRVAWQQPARKSFHWMFTSSRRPQWYHIKISTAFGLKPVYRMRLPWENCGKVTQLTKACVQ